MTEKRQGFEIRPAVPADAGELASIMERAFRTDRHTMLKDAHRPDEPTADGMREALVSWMTRFTTATVVKAVDPASGEILGWICWAREDGETTSAWSEPDPAVLEGAEAPAGSLARLEQITDGDRERWQSEVMPQGARCRYIVATAVAPEAQSRGVGSGLIAWGTSRADADDVFCWVHSSEGGRGAFLRAGFVEVDGLTVDLDAFATVPPPADSGLDEWGEYTFHYLRRPSRTESAAPAGTARR